jgi:hypothetical protein
LFVGLWQEDNRKFNVTFSDNGNLVSYVTLYQYKYQVTVACLLSFSPHDLSR